MKRFLLLLLLLLLLLCPVLSFARQLVTRQEAFVQIEAAYLVNFIKYSFWRDLKKNEPLRVYVFGSSVFEALKEAPVRTIHERELLFYEVKKDNVSFPDAHVVFIAKEMEKYVPRSFWTDFSDSTLVVSDSSKTIKNGGTIQLNIVNGKLRFIVNISRSPGVTISSKLLRMATKVIK